MKRKGSSLIMVVCVVALLSALTLVLVSQAVAAYNLTSRNEKNDKVYLMAESGVQMGMDKIKSMMLSSDIDTVPNANEIETFKLDKTNDIETEVMFKDSNFDGKPCIKISSTATDSKGHTKTISADIEKNKVPNIYYDFLKNNLLTVLDEQDTSNISFDAHLAQTPINGSGNMYLQGSDIQYIPSIVTHNPVDKVNINANNLVIDLLNGDIGQLNRNNKLPQFTLNDNINIYKTGALGCIPLGPQDLNKKLFTKEKPQAYHRILDVSSDDLNPRDFDNVQPISGLGGTGTVGTKRIKDNRGIDRYVAVIKSSNCVLPEFETTVEFKLFWDLFNEYKDSHIGLLFEDIEAYNYALEKLDNMYKVYIVDGNVTILAEKLFISLGFGRYTRLFNKFDNYIIYSTGKVTFGLPVGIDSGDSLWFNNSSIMAKQVDIHDLNGLGLNFNSTLDSTYNNIYKSFLKDVFARQLINYKAQYNLKVCKWEEK